MFGAAGGGILDRLADGPHGKFLSAEDFEVFVKAFEKTGFRGGLNWYRNIDRNWEESANLPTKIQQPALMITAELDVVLRPEMAEGMTTWVPNLRKTVLIKGSGHWTQQEKPHEVNAADPRFPRGHEKIACEGCACSSPSPAAEFTKPQAGRGREPICLAYRRAGEGACECHQSLRL